MRDFGKLPSNCPPSDAQTPNQLIVYRFVKSDSPQSSDFISWRESYPDKEYPQGVTECQACSLSIYTDKQDVIKTKKRIPRFKKSMIAEGRLNNHSGVIKPTPSQNAKSHYSWWRYIEYPHWNDFTVTP